MSTYSTNSTATTSSPAGYKTSSNAMGNHVCTGSFRSPWPSSHSVTDLLGSVNGRQSYSHLPESNTYNYNYYMYLQSCGSPQQTHSTASLQTNQFTNQLSSTITNGFPNPLMTNTLQNGFQNGFTRGLSTVMPSPSFGISPQSVAL